MSKNSVHRKLLLTRSINLILFATCAFALVNLVEQKLSKRRLESEAKTAPVQASDLTAEIHEFPFVLKEGNRDRIREAPGITSKPTLLEAMEAAAARR